MCSTIHRLAMYKNRRPRVKRPPVASASQKESPVVRNGDPPSKSPKKSINKADGKNSGISKPTTTKEISLDSSEDEGLRPQETHNSSKIKQLNDNTNSKSTKRPRITAASNLESDNNSDDDTASKEKGKSLAAKKSKVNTNTKTSPKIAAQTQKFIIDTFSSDDEVPKKKSPSKKALVDESSTDDEIPPSGRGKSMLTKKQTDHMRKIITPSQKSSSDGSSTDIDALPRSKKQPGKSKEIKKVSSKNITVDESSTDDDIPQSGKGKSLLPKKPTENIRKIITPSQKSSSDDSSTDIDVLPKSQKQSDKSKKIKKIPSKNITVDESSTDDESPTNNDIPQSGKGKSLLSKKQTEKIGKIITSTQKTSSDDSSTDVDAPPKGQKRFGDNINSKGPARKRTQLSPSHRLADFPMGSLAVSSIHSPGSSPEKQLRVPTRKKTNKIVVRTQTGNPLIDQLGRLGFTFGEGEEPNRLDRDQASFVEALDSALRNDKNYPRNVDDFVRHFETFMSASMENLGRVLESTQSSDDFARKSVQECLVRLLLNVGCLQPKLWAILLAKISELIIDEDEEQANFEMLHRIMRQMRCLDRVVEGNVNICDQLFVILELATKEETKREIILLLPDVISEEDHEKAAQTISNSLASNHPLIPAYLDTLSSLVLCEETHKDIVGILIKILGRADTKYFQIIIKNLVVTSSNLEPVIRGIRQHLDLDPDAYGNDGNECFMLASTLKEVENKKALITTWMELVEETVPQQWLAVDFVALLVNYAKVKVPVMAAFKKLAARGVEGERDVEKVYPAIKSILEYDYLDTIRHILDSLFKSRSVIESRHAAFWYRFLLNNIETSHVSQKVLDDVLSHIGHSSTNPAEVSLALNSLIDAANNNKDSVVRHTQRILTLMHNLESWALPQVRQVTNLVLSLVYHNEEASGLQDTMTITIRKHLNHPSFELKLLSLPSTAANKRCEEEVYQESLKMSVVRNSKFRHVFGAFVKRENCYDNIRVSKSSLDSMACAVNPKFLAIIVESGGGAFIVIPLTKYGRVPPDAPVVDGHKGFITDIAWCPHDDCVIASASDDCTVKVWQIPEGGLTATMITPVVDLIYHQRRVNLVAWHPSANNVLLSAASDNKVAIWNVGTGEVLQALDSHPDIVFSACWNWDGSRLVTTCKDKKIRIIEPRSGTVLEEAVCHEGSKATRAIFLKNGQIFTTGFSKMSEWQYSLREQGKLAEPICLQSNDSTNGIIFPLYDPDTNMIYLCGKGDSLIRYFEVTPEPPFVHFISIFTTPDPQRGIGMMPKRGCDVKSCEVASFYRLNAAGHCQVVSMKCPRKSELFQEDLFPDTQSDEPAISADDWIRGIDAVPVLVSLRFGAAPHLLQAEHQPNVLNRMRSSSYVDIPQARERARREEDDELVPIRNSSYGNRLTTEPAPLVRPRSQTANVTVAKSPQERSFADSMAAKSPQEREVSSGAVPRRPDAQVVDVIYKEKWPAPAIVVSGMPQPNTRDSFTPPASAASQAEDLPPKYESSRRLYASLKMTPKCGACDEIILEEEYTEADKKTFHVQHFTCSLCDKPLAGNEYYQITATGLLHCVICHRYQMEDQKKS